MYLKHIPTRNDILFPISQATSTSDNSSIFYIIQLTESRPSYLNIIQNRHKTGIMKNGTTILYTTETLGDRVSKYAESVSLKIPQPIKDYHARIIEKNPKDSNYMISNFQAQALVWLARLVGAKRGRF